MERRSCHLSVLVAASVAGGIAACGGEPMAPPDPPGPPGTIRYEMKVPLAAGEEAHLCQFVRVPPSDRTHMVAASHRYTPGSHHMLLYRTDLKDIPPSQTGVRDCFDGDMMSHVRGIVYGAQTPEESQVLPSGVGLPVTPGDVLLFQAHYLNASPGPVEATVTVRLQTETPDKIRDAAGVLFFYDPFIHVPARATARAQMRCPIAKDVKLLGGVSHYHRRGVGYAAFVDPPSGPAAATPFYTSTDWEHPEPTREAISVAAGSFLRYQCQYDNSAGAREFFQGPTAEDHEMCMFTGIYYPAMSADDDLCARRDSMGTGAKTCGETTACLQACGPGSGPTSTQPPRISDCWQRCVAASCPSASRPLLDQLSCISSKCQAECAGGGDACAACVVGRCGAQLSACQGHACG